MSDRRFSFSSIDEASAPSSPRTEDFAFSKVSDKGIQQTIQNLQNEQERVQKKTFTNWMNSYLCQRHPPIKVENLFEDVKDGTVLLSLLEVLSGEKLPMEKSAKLRRPHHLANISTALNFLEKRKIKLVNINATSIADGKPSIVLGLVWTIILYFQIEETFNIVPASEGEPKKKAPLPKQNMLDWAESVLSKKYGLHIKDFGKSWTDGVAFSAMIHNIRPDLVDMDEVQKQQARINLEHAFSTAETELGIPRLLDPEDVDVEKPDEKSIMTYVAQFLKAYPEGASGVPGTNLETAEKEIKAYNSLLTWLNNEAREILATTQEPVTDRESEFLDYIGFKTELDRREPLFSKLGQKVKSGRALRISWPEWEKLDSNWQEVDEQARLWLQKLDATLPGKLGKLGQWLYKAEKLLKKQEEITDQADRMLILFAELAQEHREFFKDLNEWQQFFAQIRRAGRYEGIVLHGPEFEHMSKRLESVALSSVVRQNRLDYVHMRYKLVVSLLNLEAKLEEWTVKYGKESFVEEMLEDYIDFVDRQTVCENFDRIYAETKKLAEIYKMGGADKSEISQIDGFLDETGGRWKQVSAEINSVRSMLEEALATWKRYSACVDLLTVWLTEGEQVMTQSLEAKEEFFQDLAQYEEKFQIVNKSGHFLIDISKETTAVQIKQTLLLLNKRFTNLVDDFQSYLQNEVIGKARTEYEKGVLSVDNWLSNTIDVLEHVVKCIHADLKAYLLELDQCSNQIQEVENTFKTTTRTAQSLVKDSSEEAVTAMLEALNTQKEAILKLRQEIPERIRYLKAIMPNVESLETGILDLQHWLIEGEKVLSSHKLGGTPEDTYAELEKHKAFFKETTYQKSILESKNKVFQKICTTKAKLENVDFTPAEDLMSSANERFQNVVSSAKEWERQLETMARLWRLCQQRQQQLEEWLDTAQNILDDNEDDTDSLLRKHKMYFDQVDLDLISDFESIVSEILQYLNTTEQKHLSQVFSRAKERWDHILYHAPIRLLMLEFGVPEGKFEQSVEIAEVTLKQQQEQIKSNQNLKEALSMHIQLFQEGSLVSSCEQWLGEMNNLAQQLLKLSRSEQSLEERYLNHLERWKKLQILIDNTHHQLKQLPERWKEYTERLSDVNDWVQNVEKLIKDLNQENLSSNEYKEKLTDFQREMQNMSKYQDAFNWLEESLGELTGHAPNADTQRERERLKEIQSRFLDFKPGMDSTLQKSGILAKGYEYRDNIDKKLSWLDEIQKLAMEQRDRDIDSLVDARACLHEIETLSNKLEIEKANIQAEIETGKHLQRDRNAPTFIQQSVAELDIKWKDINEVVKARYERIQNQVTNWERYESEKATFLSYMKNAEEELEHPLEILSQESTEEDLQSKKELQNTLNNLHGSLMQIVRLNATLAEGAGHVHQDQLKGEVVDFENKLDDVSHHLDAKFVELKAVLDNWNDFYTKLHNFSDWLNEEETKLNEIYENKQSSPENQFQKLQAIVNQIYEGHATLENLEKEARGLTQNFRSKETSVLKSKLSGLRRLWESTCTHAKEMNNAVSGNVAHWQKYQTLQEQLVPWILKAEKYCVTELPKCSSLDEAKDLHKLLQTILQEHEDNLPTFEEMSIEGGYLIDQPSIHQDLEVLHKRWDNISVNLDNRSQYMSKMFESWTAYGKNLDNFQDILDRIQSRTSKEPNINTSEIQVLEHELALAKALQDDILGYEPQLNALNRLYEQVQNYASPEGFKVLKSKQDSVTSSWKNVSSTVGEGEKVLASALQHRRNFYDQLQDTEKWIKNMQRKLDSGSEIYSDELTGTAAKLKSMKDECKTQDQMFQDLHQEFKELISMCSNDEAAFLSERFDKLMQDYTQIEDLIGNREELCEKWFKYTDAQADIQAKMKDLQVRLASPDMQEKEVVEIKHEIENLQSSMQPWSREADALDNLMSAAKIAIKNRSTQRNVHFGSELLNLKNVFDTISNTTKQKEAHLGEMTQLNNTFIQTNEHLTGNLVQVKKKLNAAHMSKSNLQGLKDLAKQIEDIRDDLHIHNPDYEQLRDLARQVVTADPTKAAAIQQQLTQVSSDWEAVQAQLADKQQQYGGLINSWQRFNDVKQAVAKIVGDVDKLRKQELLFTNPEDIKSTLAEYKKAELELRANQTQLDHMTNKGMQLLEDLKKLPGFEPSDMKCDLDDVKHKWETASADIEHHRKNLQAQLGCWDQVQSGLEEAGNWAKGVVNKMDDSLRHFDDVVSVASRLREFEEEAPHFQGVMAEVNKKIKDLTELNKNKSVHSLTSAQKDVQLQFEKAGSLAKQLETMVSYFSKEHQSLLQAISDETEWMNCLKEDLSKCDDVTGHTENLIQRYETIKHLKQELSSHQRQISALQDQSTSLHRKYPSSETISVARDSASVAKKFESLIQRADHIQNSLLGQLEHQCTEAQQQHLRWLNAAKEKVSWCEDTASDYHSLEAKLAMIQEVEASYEDGEQKKQMAINNLDAIKGVLPKSKQGELEANQKNMENDWQNLVKSMRQTKKKLDISVEQWHKYDHHVETLSQWLKDSEAKMKSEASLKPDAASKMEQLEQLKVLDQSIQSHHAEFDDVRIIAQQISQDTGNGRTISHVGLLVNRYQTLTSAVKEMIGKCDKNFKDHNEYLDKHKVAREWLDKVKQSLEKCSSLVGDENSLNTKLAIVKDLVSHREEGSYYFNAAVEAGERLYPTTSVEGRECIRCELRSLREEWDSFSNNLSDSQRELDSIKMQWMSFDESFDQLNKWVADMEEKADVEPELKATLHEKKALLQACKTHHQAVLSYQTMIDSISDKGATLSSVQVQNKLKQLNSKYNNLLKMTESCLNQAEDNVNKHQLYQDTYEQCFQWMNAVRERAAVCADLSGDKETLHNRLEILQELVVNLPEGEIKVKSVHQQGEKIMPHTSAQGQTIIRRELDSLSSEWDLLIASINDNQQGLIQAVKAVEMYDGSCEVLQRWLKEMETQFKNCELKSTLQEKETQLELFKFLQQEINSKQSQFSELQNVASQLQLSDARLANYSSQLTAKYETLRNNTQDMIVRWADYVKEHREFQDNYGHCMEWVDTLQKRLQVCGDNAVDKQDIEDRMSKLQELLGERDGRANCIHKAIDTGERLFPNTSSAGRDAIRLELRNLKENWEALCDEVIEVQRKLDVSLSHWSSYYENFEDMQRWLLTMEVELKEDTELQATLHEKKAKLQNHQIFHRDILARDHTIAKLTEKAHTLTQSAPSAKVKNFVDELKHKYAIICETSKDVLDKLEHSLQDHQKYQDAAQAFSNWLSSAKERLEACAELSGDRLSLKSKKDKLKDLSSAIKEGENRLNHTKNLAAITANNSSQLGKDILQRELDHLQREWDDYLANMKSTEHYLDKTIALWDTFDAQLDQLYEWLKNMEQNVKGHELKNTFKEKQTQLEKFKKQRDEILGHKSQVEGLTDNAQVLMHASSDVRLNSQVSQLTNRYQGLLSLIKDQTTKWEKYAQEHLLYDKSIEGFKEWMTMASDRFSQYTQPVYDQKSVEEKAAMIQMLYSEKDQGFHKLRMAVESGEKLYPDTGAAGRENIRGELRVAKQDLENFMSDLNNAQQSIHSSLQQWSSYVDGQKQIQRWMAETEAVLRADAGLKSTLQEKKNQLQTHKNLLQDILSKQRMVDSVIGKAQDVMQNSSIPQLSEFITNISSRFEKLVADAKNVVQKLEQHVNIHQKYQDSKHAATEWLVVMKDKTASCTETMADKHTIQSKLDQLHELIIAMPEGATKLKDCENHAQVVSDTSDMKGRQTIQSELKAVHADWDDYSTKLSSLKDMLEQAEQQWNLYESRYQKISSWLKSVEKQITEHPLQSTLEEKQEQLLKCKELLQEIQGQQREVVLFTDEAQTLQHLVLEPRVSNMISQLTSRYQSLLTSAKDLVKRCRQNVEDHKAYKTRFAESASWLEKAKMLFSQCLEVSSTRGELEDKFNRVQELIRERDVGYSKLSDCVEVAEKLYPNTAPSGREVIRLELRKLKLGYESMFDDLSTIQRKLEVSMLQWNSFDESYDQMENWLRQMEFQFEGQMPIRATLAEKKSQLYNYKALQQDVLSYQRLIDSITDKARSLVQTDRDSKLATSISQTEARYKKLCLAAKERTLQCQTYVNEHQRYSDLYNSSVEWLNAVRKQVSACSDVSGGRQGIQNHLDHIQDILTTKTEGESKVKEVVELSRKILPNTAPVGKAVITRETEALKTDWEAFTSALRKVRNDLEAYVNYWKAFENLYERCMVWLKDMESRLWAIDLKATLPEKQAQLEKIKVFQSEIVNHQNEFSSINNAAEELMKVSTDYHVEGQASQLITRYQTTVRNIQESCRSWEQYVLDHQAYMQSFDKCRNWLAQMKEKMTYVVTTNGDKSTLQDRLGAVQKFMTETEEGLQMFQKSLDNLQAVLPTTSVSGRDILSRDMHALQQEYDALSVSLTDAKFQLDGTLAQWTVYNDSVEQLQRWLSDLENQVSLELALQNTLQEKKLQLDRVKVLKLNISSQQSMIDSLNEKAQHMKQTSHNSNFESQISPLIDRYDQLVKKVKNLTENCEKNLQHHQLYRDSYMDTSDWLGTVIDKLSFCSDVQGDKHSIEIQLRKVEDIASILEVGRRKLQGTQQNGNSVIPETSAYGQTLINEELKLLTNDFDSFETDVNDLRNTLVTLRDKWTGYEDMYEELCKWLKDTKADMKADSGLRASLDQKISQLNKHKTVHGEIMQQQEAFDQLSQLAHALMQSSPGSRVSTQFTHLNSQYLELTSFSRNLLKKHEQKVQDHEQYSNSYNRCKSWLQHAIDRLSVCSNTSGDRHKIQVQLEKLQEFIAAKEEGRALLHMAVTCGEKVMVDTSVEGQYVIRTGLEELQEEWDRMTSQMKDITTKLELCLHQWNDYCTSNEQVMKWLKDIELRLQDARSKSNLSEKKAELQQVKGMYQDIESYEQMVESVTCKAANLAEKSPANRPTIDTTHMQTRYENVKEQAKDLLSYSEQNVSHHQNYLDSCHRFSSWLRAVSDQLKTICDTNGNRSAIQAKLEQAEFLMANLNEGTQYLTQARQAGEVILPNTSDCGQIKIQQELQNVNKNFDTFQMHLSQTCAVLENCLSCWNEFETKCQEFGAWLTEMEVLLHTELDLKSTVGEKKELWKKFQLLREDVLSHQTALETVNEKAQTLLKITSEANISDTVRHLTAGYSKVIALVEEKTSNLEADYNIHKLYHQNHQLFTDWLMDTNLRLQAVKDVSGSRATVKHKISEIKEIQDTLGQGRGFLHTVQDSCEKTVFKTNDRGIHVIRSEADKAKADYEKVVTEVSQVKQHLEKVFVQWEDFENLYLELTRWMSHVEQDIKVLPGFKVDLSEKRSNLERYKAIQADILSHRSQLNALEDKAGQLQDSYSRSKAVELNSRYAALVKNSKDVVGQIEEKVGSYEEYRKSYDECYNWLAKTKHQFEHLTDCTGDKKTLQGRLHQLRDFKASLSQGHELLNLMTIKGKRLCDGTTSLQGQDVLLKERKSLLEDWKVFASAVDDIEHKFETSIAQWKDLDDENHAFNSWLEMMESNLKDFVQPTANLSKKRSQLQEAEDLFDEILSYRSELNQFRAQVDTLSRKGIHGGMSSNTRQLSARYQALCALAEDTVGKLREYVYEHRFYDEILDKATSWLQMMRIRVQTCSDSSGDWHDIQDRIEDIKDVIISMDEGLQMVNAVCDQAERILPFITLEGKKFIEQQATELTNNWENLNSDIAECSAVLEGVQQRWHEYEEYYGSLIKWLADTESFLQSSPELIAELADRKTQLDNFKFFMVDVENHHRLLNELADRIANLEALCDNPEVTDSLAEIQDRYVNIVDRSKEIVELLQRGYDEHQSFSEAHQDCEKWLLAISYRLMAHNTLNTSKLEPTERQKEKHKLILKEIEDYRLTVDSVIKQGQQLIRNNSCQARLATQVQAQLTNLSESYSNLQSTANQIRMTSLVSYSPNAILHYL